MGVGLIIFYANILFSNMRLCLKADELLSELTASRKTLYGPTFNADNYTLKYPKICTIIHLNVKNNIAHFIPSSIFWDKTNYVLPIRVESL